MKNIHVLPTDKPSRLSIRNNILISHCTQCRKNNQNIYITSDEEIKEGDWVLDDEQDIFQVLEINHTQGILRSDGFTYVIDVCKKIILTTDLDLIQDGIQKIDDEFLEWFVKNPSCEEVEVVKDYSYGNLEHFDYKIIFAREEPKRPTTEELTEKIFCNNKETLEEFDYLKGFINQFEEGHELQELSNDDWTVSRFLTWMKLNKFKIVKNG